MSIANPAVTAVIPTRNRAELVQRAVRSALSQTFCDLEVVVVVDGPDPVTVTALEAIQSTDSRLRIVALDAGVGGAEARNMGVRAAQGEWIALLDDDDEWLPEKIELQMDRARKSGSTGTVVVSKYICRSETADRIRPRRLPREGEPICEYMFDYLCYFQTSTFFCSRTLLLEIPFQKTLGGFQDIDWFLRVNSVPGVSTSVVPEVLSIYYAPEERASITSNLSWKQRFLWGQNNRPFMTRLAYSRFIVGSCAARAVEEKAGLRVYWSLLREYLFAGRPTPSGAVLLLGMYAVSPRWRRRIRNSFFLSSPPEPLKQMAR
jgi:glycosyltransferase involved in cell wall biosynthesis